MLKRYTLHQSPLYRLNGIGRFKEIIGMRWDAIDTLLASDHYHVFLNEKGRWIQQPIGPLAVVHTRIGELLARIELPDYLFSKKGRSYSDNARQHLGSVPMIKTDIHKFYPSTTRQMVFQMFVDEFQCAEDIAHRLADICCYRQEHLPTGSTLSGRVAFLAAKNMFDKIEELVLEAHCKMTVYVDDIAVSGDAASMRLLGAIRKIISSRGFKTKQKKTKSYPSLAPKTLTGTIIARDELRLPNVRHKNIWETRQELATACDDNKKRIQRKLTGQLQQARQILQNS